MAGHWNQSRHGHNGYLKKTKDSQVHKLDNYFGLDQVDSSFLFYFFVKLHKLYSIPSNLT